MPTSFRTVELSDPAIPADGLRHATLKSRALGRRADLTYFLTPGAEAAHDLPIVILLHGVYGSHWAWALKGDAHRTAARLVEDGTIPPMALLMPSDGLWGDGSGYLPHANADYERWIVDEVPAFAAEAIPACSTDSPVCIAGLSMGGYGALRLAGKHPARFAAAAAHSTMTDIAQFDALLEEPRVGWSDAPIDASVLAALLGAKAALPPLRFDCGRSDPFIEANRALHAVLDVAGIAHRYEEFDGGHEWPYWTAHLARSLRFFGRVLRGANDVYREDHA
ncbi:MAG: alpha/beta hydrolase-fold protein [Thermomonas sp.]|uniref:alpha/beta hydrolase n=1 Tax=Thermomonas sp. TaxID=1971895 RepID=UPI0039E511E2